MIAFHYSVAIFMGALSLGGGASSFCEEFERSHELDKASLEVSAVLEVCEATLLDYSGAFVVVEDKYLPVPSEFVIDSDNARFRLSMLPREAVVGDSSWSYGHLYVGSSDQSLANVEYGRVDVRPLDPPQALGRCDFELGLYSYSIYFEDGSYFKQATELRLPETVVVIFGGNPNLLRAMTEAFVRLNCVSVNRGQPRN